MGKDKNESRVPAEVATTHVMIVSYHAAYVLDASVAFKWFTTRRETDRDAALALRERHVSERCRLIVPEFFFLEVLNVIRFHTQATEEDTSSTLVLLEQLSLQVEPVSWNLLRKTNGFRENPKGAKEEI